MQFIKRFNKSCKKDYVLLLRLDGISNWELLKSTILPNISAIYTQEIARAFVVAILDITALSFISLGAQRPMPEWGAMIKDSLEFNFILRLGLSYYLVLLLFLPFY